MIWSALGVGGGTAPVVLASLYFVIKWAVRNGVQEAHARPAGETQGWFQKFWAAIVPGDKAPD